MNEKQRLLAKDLEDWRRKRMSETERDMRAKVPLRVRLARRDARRAERIVENYERRRYAVIMKARAAINDEVSRVKRIILFESTAAALKAIRSLRER